MPRRPRRTTQDPQRIANMRKNSRNIGQNQPFQGGISQGSVMSPQGPGQGPGQGGQPPMTCPPGLEPGVDDAGQKTCKPAQANIAGTVPVVNSGRATNPTPGKPITGKGY